MPNLSGLSAELQDMVFSHVGDSRKLHLFLFDRSTHASAKIALYTHIKLTLWNEESWFAYYESFLASKPRGERAVGKVFAE